MRLMRTFRLRAPEDGLDAAGGKRGVSLGSILGNPRNVKDPECLHTNEAGRWTVEKIAREVLREAAAGEPVALARTLVATPSVNPDLEQAGTGEHEIAHLIAGWLDGWGYEVGLEEVAPGRWNVMGRRGHGRSLLLNGHLDTVGVGGMTVPPFAGDVQDGRLVGRGACDMKGGVAALLAAAAAAAGEPAAGQLIVALTGDEERASLGMQALVEAGIQADAAVVCEPTSLAVAPAHKGFVWIELEFRGRAAHGSRPEEGVDAIRHAGAFLRALDGWEATLEKRPRHPLLGWGTIHAGTIEGGSAPSIYPARCRLTLERRTLPGETAAQVMDEVAGIVQEVEETGFALDVDSRVALERPGTEVSQDTPLVRGLLNACAGEGLERRVEPMTAWVDAAFLNEAGIPAVCFGPGSIARAHSADEWAPVDEIARCARVLQEFARTFWAEGG